MKNVKLRSMALKKDALLRERPLYKDLNKIIISQGE